MAFNPSKEVAIARDAAVKLGSKRVVIFYTLPSGLYGYASYGETSALCKQAKQEADSIFLAVGEAFAEAQQC